MLHLAQVFVAHKTSDGMDLTRSWQDNYWIKSATVIVDRMHCLAS